MEYLTITQVNTLARGVLEEYSVWITGEVSNCSADKYYYKYFSLKDENASIACVYPSAKLSSLDFSIENGITIKAFGKLSVYEKGGTFQFKAEIIQKDGEGNLQAQIEEIKERLQKEGLLDASRKRKLPLIPARIAVITSKDGAAWKDFFKILGERYANCEVLLYDVLVQGDKAAESVMKGLTYINTLEDIDCIVITRGGGSLEDLMAFNDEKLARAVAASKYPVVSAIGHEKDISICDLVADLRASTPSNAAELISPHTDSLYQGLDSVHERLHTWINERLTMYTLQLEHVTARSCITERTKFNSHFSQELAVLTNRMASHKRIYESYGYLLNECSRKLMMHAQAFIHMQTEHMDSLYANLYDNATMFTTSHERILERIGLQLEGNNPLHILDKGYSIARDKDGAIIRHTTDIKTGEVIQTQLVDGMINSSVLSIKNN